MSVMNVFTRPPAGYTRDIDIVKAAKEQAIQFLTISTGDSREKVTEWLDKAVGKSGSAAFKDPAMRAAQRESNGDREVKVTSYLNYINQIKDEGLTFTPTLTSYLPPEVKRGSAADFIDAGITNRAFHKKKMKQAIADGNKELATIEDLNQSSAKLDNNSYSGAMAIANSILFLASGHPSLTSTCRTTTSYANANNEKLLGGNRHYWSFDITMANLTCLTLYTDLDALNAVMNKYCLHWPTVEETVSVVKYSTTPYWSNRTHLETLKNFIANCTPIQRAAICYINDLYHIRVYNDAFMRRIFDKLIIKDTDKVNEVMAKLDISDFYSGIDDDLSVMMATICRDQFGKTASIGNLLKENPEVFKETMARAYLAEEFFKDYSDFWRVIVANDIMPHTVAAVKYIYRRVVVGGDTDSTIFTSQNWTEWYTGKLKYDSVGTAVTGVTTFLASKTIAHILFSMSKNMGVSDTRLDQLGLKNEFFFPVFGMTGKAKHYFTYQGIKEGVFLDPPKPEIKGVGLRGSNVPPIIFKMRSKLFTTVMDQVLASGKVDWKWLLGMQSALEHEIERSILAGEKTYLARLKIKEKEQYKTPMSSSYAHYDLYEKVFMDKYGDPGPLPWSAVKIPLTADTKTDLKEWIASIKDTVIRERLAKWLKDNNKTKYTTIGLPTSMIDSRGIPEEIANIINTDKIKEEVSSAMYIVAEACGLYFLSGSDKYHTLISDQVPPDKQALMSFINEFLDEDGKDDSLYQDESDDMEGDFIDDESDDDIPW